MEATRILPDLQCSLLCEEVRQEINGNFILLGILSFVRVPQLPITAMRLCLFNRWTAGVGTFQEKVRVLGPDQLTVLRQGEVRFILQDPTHNATNVTVLNQVKFETAGVYYLEVSVDDVMKLRFPLPIVLAPPPTNPPPTGAESAGG